MVGHTRKKVIKCHICDKLFMSKTDLKAHKLLHKERKFCCTFDGCTKKFFQPGLLKKHIKMHNDERDFACSLCDKKFFVSYLLRRHERNFHKKKEK